MYYIIVKEIYEKSGEKFYLYQYKEKEKLTSYSSDIERAQHFNTKQEAEDFNKKIPKLINGLVISQ